MDCCNLLVAIRILNQDRPATIPFDAHTVRGYGFGFSPPKAALEAADRGIPCVCPSCISLSSQIIVA